MKIDRVSVSRPPTARRSERSGKAKAGGFTEALAGKAVKPASVSEAAPLAPVDALVSLQEVGDAGSGRSRGLRRGHDLLDRLDELRRGLMLGTLTRSQVERLRALAAERRNTIDDPRLAEILTEIEIRAAVELAKLGR